METKTLTIKNKTKLTIEVIRTCISNEFCVLKQRNKNNIRKKGNQMQERLKFCSVFTSVSLISCCLCNKNVKTQNKKMRTDHQMD